MAGLVDIRAQNELYCSINAKILGSGRKSREEFERDRELLLSMERTHKIRKRDGVRGKEWS